MDIFFCHINNSQSRKTNTWLELDDEMKPEATWAIFFP